MWKTQIDHGCFQFLLPEAAQREQAPSMRVPHSFIYTRGSKSEDLLAVVNFLYHGEANVFQQNLDSFLAIAEELQLKGLMGKTDEKIEDYKEVEKYLSSTFSSKIPKTAVHRQAPNRNIHNLEEYRTLTVDHSWKQFCGL